VECSSKSCKCRCWRASSEKEYLAILKKSSRRKESTVRILTEKIDEIPSAVRSREVAQGLSPSKCRGGVPEESSGY
jgi:hypothetical protein